MFFCSPDGCLQAEDCSPAETAPPAEVSYPCLLVQLGAIIPPPCSTVCNKLSFSSSGASTSESLVHLIPAFRCHLSSSFPSLPRQANPLNDTEHSKVPSLEMPCITSALTPQLETNLQSSPIWAARCKIGVCSRR